MTHQQRMRFSEVSARPLAIAASFVSGSAAVLNATREFLANDSPPPIAPSATLSFAALTEREKEVLSLLAGGRTGREIAEALCISLSTTQRHIANIYTKIGARGRVDAATYALSRGLVRPRASRST